MDTGINQLKFEIRKHHVTPGVKVLDLVMDIDGERIRGWTDNFSSNEVPTLPEVFEKLGNEGWEMVSHVINQDIKQNGVTLHYYNFKREKL